MEKRVAMSDTLPARFRRRAQFDEPAASAEAEVFANQRMAHPKQSKQSKRLSMSTALFIGARWQHSRSAQLLELGALALEALQFAHDHAREPCDGECIRESASAVLAKADEVCGE